jgi:peptidoglycan-N-acetylglucosamine deacetylase
MGVKTWRIISAARGSGHHVITWSRRAIDGIRPNTQRILNRLVPHTRAGDIVILHDGVEPHTRRDSSQTIAAIKPLIQQLRDRGLEPARLDRLIALPAYQSAI